MGHDHDEQFGEELQGFLLARNTFVITMVGFFGFIFATYFSIMT